MSTPSAEAIAVLGQRGEWRRTITFWLAVAAGTLVLAGLAHWQPLAWLAQYPPEWQPPIAVWINQAMDWFLQAFRPLFRALETLLRLPMTGLEWLLIAMPWVVVVGLVALLAHAARGWKLVVFVVLAMLYIAGSGYWNPTMRTLALVGVAVPLSVAVGFGLGVLGHRHPRFRAWLVPLLDIMQTVPTFAYLVPILVLFGFGPVVGMIASAIYAMPPMVRNVLLGLDQVPREQIEVGQISGSSGFQLFWWVKFPSALRSIMMGVNQTIMMALSMVIIAAVIGGSHDIGWIVLNAMQRAAAGPSLLSGMVIVLIAMIADRISLGFGARHGARHRHATWWRRFPRTLLAAALVVVVVPLAQWIPALASFPAPLELSQFARDINDAVDGFVRDQADRLELIKGAIQYYVLLPLRIGLPDTVNPMTWGIEMSRPVTIGFLTGVALLAALLWRLVGLSAVVALLFYAALYYFGAPALPWSVFTFFIVAMSWRVAGPRVAAFALGVCAFLVLSGVWERAMLTFAVISVAVVLAFPVGALLGLWAARNDVVSAILRPLNDTLQTLPPFVYLIPAVMLFQVGTFTALVAVVAYCIVPAIRYTELGLRQVDPEVVEAGRAMGTSRWQLLREVELPLARPTLLLGLNQTVMMALAMLVIAALVGTRGLGQYVYEGLTNADMGIGVIAGGGIALMAILTAQLLQAAAVKSHPRRPPAGLGVDTADRYGGAAPAHA